jgi:hypothetical protein
MAGPLAAMERFFERLFERPAARLFQARLEIVHLQRALERAMESERRVHSRRAYSPSAFRMLLNASDLAALEGDRATIARGLAEHVRIYARGRGYVLLARPYVALESSSAVPAGDVRAYAEPVIVPAAGAARQPPQPSPPPPSAPPPASGSATGDANVSLGHATAIFAAPKASAPRAQLALRSPGRTVSRVPVRPGTIRVGRAMDNDVVLIDDKVSRHHGQIGVRLGMLVYTDLGSTNGSYLNGSPVSEIALGPGDVLQLGSSTVTIEPAN